jgi:hypothetical protein
MINRCIGDGRLHVLVHSRRRVTNNLKLYTGQQAAWARVPAMARLSEPFWEMPEVQAVPSTDQQHGSRRSTFPFSG